MERVCLKYAVPRLCDLICRGKAIIFNSELSLMRLWWRWVATTCNSHYISIHQYTISTKRYKVACNSGQQIWSQYGFLLVTLLVSCSRWFLARSILVSCRRLVSGLRLLKFVCSMLVSCSWRHLFRARPNKSEASTYSRSFARIRSPLRPISSGWGHITGLGKSHRPGC